MNGKDKNINKASDKILETIQNLIKINNETLVGLNIR